MPTFIRPNLASAPLIPSVSFPRVHRRPSASARFPAPPSPLAQLARDRQRKALRNEHARCRKASAAHRPRWSCRPARVISLILRAAQQLSHTCAPAAALYIFANVAAASSVLPPREIEQPSDAVVASPPRSPPCAAPRSTRRHPTAARAPCASSCPPNSSAMISHIQLAHHAQVIRLILRVQQRMHIRQPQHRHRRMRQIRLRMHDLEARPRRIRPALR